MLQFSGIDAHVDSVGVVLDAGTDSEHRRVLHGSRHYPFLLWERIGKDLGVAHWLMKSEPEELSIDDLARAKRKRFPWDGVRNYRARNWMQQMKPGEQFFFAHSSCKVPGIAGIAEIVGEAYPDPTQFDSESHYYDPASPVAKPRWVCRDVRYVERFPEVLPLVALRQHADQLGAFHLLQKANRLSVMPVSEAQWNFIIGLVPRRPSR